MLVVVDVAGFVVPEIVGGVLHGEAGGPPAAPREAFNRQPGAGRMMVVSPDPSDPGEQATEHGPVRRREGRR